MENLELEKGKIHTLVDIIDYVPHSVLSRTILRKATGNVMAAAYDEGELMEEKISPFDTFIEIIDGASELTVNQDIFVLDTGQCMVVPAHSLFSILAKVPFKMLSTVIKSGYETVSTHSV
jgi:hypothetical protein